MSSKKSATIIEKFRAIEKIGTEVEVPFHVHRIVGGKQMSIVGNQICIGNNDCDYASLTEAREALEWYVNQLGGNVQWREL